ncbi:MAG TPA: DUF1428 domain-containing protein [Verrucomicrobiae bacterium]|jgi:uncharacterized protein YbaA (DUF1428 family)|nr:DUF1428 domain-containing protein [Verrucomicrobiae bacterium]
MKYVEGFVVPVPKKNLAAYRRHSMQMSKVCRKHGAIEHVVTWADDVKPGKWTSFPQSVKLKPGETVVFAYTVFKSRAARDKAWKKIMNDPAVHKMMKTQMPFDGRRMFWGGFKSIVDD